MSDHRSTQELIQRVVSRVGHSSFSQLFHSDDTHGAVSYSFGVNVYRQISGTAEWLRREPDIELKSEMGDVKILCVSQDFYQAHLQNSIAATCW